MQTKGKIELAENDRDPVGDPTQDLAIDPVGGYRGNLTEDVQSQPQQNRSLTGGANSQPQQDVDVMEVDPPEISDPRIVEVVADRTTADRADNLSNSVSDSELRAHVAVLRKQKERAQLRAKLERLEREKADGFVDERH